MTRPHILALALALALLSPAARAGGLPAADPAALGFDPGRLALASQAVREAVEEGEVPGAVVLVGRHGKIALVDAFGRRSVEPSPEPMTRDTVFDLASLTKPVATATAVMLLWQDGKLDPRDLLSKHLPEFANHGKEAITLEHLLRHRSGLIADNPLSDYADGPDKSWERLANLKVFYPPGSRFLYSDVNFLILGRLVERLSGQTLDQFAKEHVFTPLGMADTTFLPLDAGLPADRIAPTEPDDGLMLRGIVHDPRSRALGGVAGHAGLFGTADDLAVYLDSLLRRSPVLAGPTAWAMTDPGDTPDGQRRGLGWDVATGFSAPRGARFGPRSFGHTGFTGTSLWADPDTGAFVILLTSRLHPSGGKPSPTSLRRKLASLVAEAIADQPPPEPTSSAQPVLCGIDVLASEGFARLKGKRVGLVTNHTGRTRSGQPTIDALFKAPDVQLTALFSPEHGIRGAVDTKVSDSTDEATGLPIYSLYGETRKPKPEHLADLDVLVYDIQDIGCRFYTYISTLVHVLEAARERGIPLVVLDRPNPIGGLAVEGPVRDDGFESFIAIHDLPVRHGMTVGELALMFNAERKIGADLDVVACQNWNRADLYDRTGLEWVNPSPNMRSLTEALLYPGVGLLEATNLATGRGTDTPFERVGAPWIDPLAWASALNAASLPGVRFLPIHFTPTERQHANKECGGVYIAITDRDRFEPISLCFAMVRTLRSLYPDDWKPEGFLRFITDKQAYESSLAGQDYPALRASWREELASFQARRAAFLLYP